MALSEKDLEVVYKAIFSELNPLKDDVKSIAEILIEQGHDALCDANCLTKEPSIDSGVWYQYVGHQNGWVSYPYIDRELQDIAFIRHNGVLFKVGGHRPFLTYEEQKFILDALLQQAKEVASCEVDSKIVQVLEQSEHIFKTLRLEDIGENSFLEYCNERGHSFFR